MPAFGWQSLPLMVVDLLASIGGAATLGALSQRIGRSRRAHGARLEVGRTPFCFSPHSELGAGSHPKRQTAALSV